MPATQTERVIATLAAQLQPVRRLRSPLLRALLWLAVVGAVGGVLIAREVGLGIFLQRFAVPRVAVEDFATALTAITAVIAAFELSVPGHSPRWVVLPVLPFWYGSAPVDLAVFETVWACTAPPAWPETVRIALSSSPARACRWRWACSGCCAGRGRSRRCQWPHSLRWAWPPARRSCCSSFIHST